MALGKVGTFALKIGRVISAHAPEILMGIGAISVTAGAITVATQTTKLEDALSDIRDAQAAHKEKYGLMDPKTYKKELTAIKLAAAKKVAKIYAGPALLLGGGMICFFSAFGILKKRNGVLVASLAAANKAFEEYRARVVADQGEDKDKEYLYGLKKKTITKEVVDENGKKKTVKEEVFTSEAPIISRYAIRFTPEFSTEAYDDVNTNKNMLRSIQNAWNAVLPSRKKVFLNEIYHELGIDETMESRLVGWDYNADEHGDGKIKFIFTEIIVYDQNDPRGWHDEVIVDFNVDGDIAHKLPKNPAMLGMEVEDHILRADRVCEVA